MKRGAKNMAEIKRFEQNDNMNAICYYRCASASLKDCSLSIEEQRQEVHDYCKKHGYHIIGEYEDKGISGMQEDRPALQQMLDDAKHLRPAYLVLWKTDRLSRNRLDSAIVKSKLREYGVRVECVAERMPENKDERLLLEGIEKALIECSTKKSNERSCKYYGKSKKICAE